MNKKIFTILTIAMAITGSVFLFSPAKAQFQRDLNIYFFRGDGCPHCDNELKFLNEIEKDYPQIKIYNYEIFYNRDNAKLLEKIVKELKMPYRGTPYTVIGDKVFSGFTEVPTADDILDRVEFCVKNDCPDSVATIVGAQITENQTQPKPEKPEGWPEQVYTPWGTKINTSYLSLPAFTAIIGLLDGFNPCAMWALIFLISLLIGMKNRKRMWFFGATFIVTSGAVYFVVMSAWLNLLLFVGMIIWVRLAIGLVALVAGGYNIKEYIEKKDDTCKVTKSPGRLQMFDRLKNIVYRQNFFLALIGIIALALSVNLVELICSAGFPAVYTQVLSLSNLPSWQYYFYLLLYIVFYMLDDMIVFILSMWALRVTGLTTKYIRWSNLIGGILMLLLGLLLIFKPSWLMFG